MPTILYVGGRWRLYTITEPTYKNFQSGGHSGEYLKLFYVMPLPVLHKKSRQSLRVSPESSFDWKLFKVGSVIVYSFIKTSPTHKIVDTPLPLLQS